MENYPTNQIKCMLSDNMLTMDLGILANGDKYISIGFEQKDILYPYVCIEINKFQDMIEDLGLYLTESGPRLVGVRFTEEGIGVTQHYAL